MIPQLVTSADRVGRKQRHPKHTFHTRQKPFGIQPMMIAPVLPGETLKNLLLQARVVTDPIKARLTGWWCEYYFFYCKARDLAYSTGGVGQDSEAAIRQFFVDPTFDAGPILESSYQSRLYFYADSTAKGVSWTARCLRNVVEHFFRDEGEAWDIMSIDGLPMAQIVGNSWIDSLQRKTEVLQGDPTLTVGADDLVTGSEVENLMRQIS